MWLACVVMAHTGSNGACLRDNTGFGHCGIQLRGFTRSAAAVGHTGFSTSTLKP
jgi:hypothetical protein